MPARTTPVDWSTIIVGPRPRAPCGPPGIEPTVSVKTSPGAWVIRHPGPRARTTPGPLTRGRVGGRSRPDAREELAQRQLDVAHVLRRRRRAAEGTHQE